MASRREPRDAPSYILRGRSHVQAQEWEQAVSDFTSTLKLRPDDVDALLRRGIVHAIRGQDKRTAPTSTKSSA